MNQTIPIPTGHANRKRNRIAGVVFALAPWVSLGLATPAAFTVAAVLFSRVGKIHAVILWSSAAIYTAALTTEFAEANTSNPADDHVFTACLIITMVVGGLQALSFALVATMKGYRPIRGTPTTGAPAKADPARRTRTRAEYLAAALFVSITFPLVALLLIDDTSFQRHHGDATATITSVRVSTECGGYPVPTCTDQYYPTVRFTTGQGDAIEVATSDFRAENTSTIKKGNTIAVHYDPNDPRDARLSTGWDGHDVFLISCMIVIYGGILSGSALDG
jgi:hypothetical protein